MFRSLTLLTKIGMGSGVVIFFITVVISGLRIWQIKGVHYITENLSTHNLPEAGIANGPERLYSATIFSVRGYAFTGDESFFTMLMAKWR